MSAAICSRSSGPGGVSSRKEAQSNQVAPTAVQLAPRPGAAGAQPSRARLCQSLLPSQLRPPLLEGPAGQEKAKRSFASCCEQPAGVEGEELGGWGWPRGEGQGAGPPHVCPRSALSRLEEPLLGRVAEVSAPRQMRGLCGGSIPLLTRNFGLCALELIKFREKPARLEHGSLHRQSPVLSHRGTCWDDCKGPNSDVHRLERQARRGSIGSAAQGREGCRVTRVALGMVLCPRPAPEAQRGGMGHEQGSPSSARAVSGCT